MAEVFTEIALIIIFASIVGYIAKRLKQPIIPAYILAGALIGPIFGLIDDKVLIASLSEIGVAFLLFGVGLELNINKIKETGNIAIWGGLIQFLLTAMFGYLISFLLGLGHIAGIYVGVMISFSSTVIVVKLLGDKKEMDTLHARIIIGMLLMQDVIAILCISLMGSFEYLSPAFILFTILKAGFLCLICIACAKYIFPKIFEVSAKSQDLLLLVSLSVCFVFSLLFIDIGNILIHLFRMVGDLSPMIVSLLKPGFSLAIGAFAAGVTIGNLPYYHDIIAKMYPLKEFFSVIFFLSLGINLAFENISHILIPIILIACATIIGKGFIIFIICKFFGYSKRNAFLSAISLAQISEFSLILVSQGVLYGQIGSEMTTLSVLLAALTMAVSTYLVKYGDGLYLKLDPVLSFFDRFRTKKKEYSYGTEKKPDVVLIGYNRLGYGIHKSIAKLKKRYLIVDFNPVVIKSLISKKIPCLYGDVADQDIILESGVLDAKMIISTIPSFADNVNLIEKVKKINKKCTVFVTAYLVDDAINLYEKGADYVIFPHLLGGEHVSLLIEKISKGIGKLDTIKLKHILALNKRKTGTVSNS